jgi:hypothetical protein
MLLCSIYGLCSTKNGVIRYIGQTKQPLQSRLTQHLAEAARSRGNSRCHRWIRKELSAGHSIEIRLIEDGCAWDEAEKRWIEIYRQKHPGIMTNLSSGGCGYAGPRSDETRLRMSKPKSESHKAKMRKPKALTTRTKMSDALKGNKRGQGQKNGNAVLNEILVIDIKDRLNQGQPLSGIAKVHGTTKATIWKIKAGYSWVHVA